MKKKVVPWPSGDSTQIRPPCRATIFLQIASPIPVPGYSSAVETLKYDEYSVRVLGVYPYAVVTHGKHPVVIVGLSGNVHQRRPILAKFYRIVDQILKKLRELSAVARHSGKRIVGHQSIGVIDSQLKIAEA